MGLISGFKKAYAKHGGAWFAVGAIVATVTEGVLAYRAGKRSGQHPEWDTKQKALNVAAPVAAGAASIGCTLAGQHKNAGEIATLVSSQVLNEKKRQQWMKKATEIVGEENMNKIKASMHPNVDVPDPESGLILIVDDFTGAKAFTTMEKWYAGVDHFHALYHTQGYASHGDLLGFCKFERFDGKTNQIPVSEDYEGRDISGLSDEQIGYSSAKMWNDGWDHDWIDIWLTTATDEKTGRAYYIQNTSMYPIANYLNDGEDDDK